MTPYSISKSDLPANTDLPAAGLDYGVECALTVLIRMPAL